MEIHAVLTALGLIPDGHEKTGDIEPAQRSPRGLVPAGHPGVEIHSVLTALGRIPDGHEKTGDISPTQRSPLG